MSRLDDIIFCPCCKVGEVVVLNVTRKRFEGFCDNCHMIYVPSKGWAREEFENKLRGRI